MSIQIITAVAQTSGLNPAATATVDPLDGAPAGIGFADLLAQQMLLPEAKMALTTEPGKVSTDADASAAADAEQTISDLTEQLLPWLPNTPGLTANTTHVSHGTPEAPGQQRLSKGLPVEPGRALAQLASVNGQEHRASPVASDPLAGSVDKPIPDLPTLPRAAADAAAPRLANAVFTIANDSGKAAEAITAKTAGGPELSNLTATSHAHAPAPQAAQTRDANPATPISTPLHDNRWATDFGQKVVWMARAEQQNAQININPPQLGPIQITINLDGDKASAVFASPHSEVRQAIETAMPRLREMLADAGINLGQANVGSQFAQQQNPQENRQGTSESGRLAVDNAILPGQAGLATGGTVAIAQGAKGLVDLFA